MKTVKRTAAISIVACMLLTLILAGCSSAPDADNAAGEGGSQGDKPEAVTLKFWKSGTEKTEQDYWMSMLEQYKALNPHVTIEFTATPVGQEFETKLNAAFASGSAPDLIGHNIGSIAGRAIKGQYAVLDDWIAGWSDKDDIMPSVYEAGSYKGNVYGMGYFPGPFLFVYRKDYFEEANLDPENPPTTWEELADVAEKLTIREGDMVTRAGFNIPSDNSRLIGALLHQNGVQLMDDEGNPTWNSPEFVETIAYLTDLYKDRNVAIQITEKADDQQSLFITGQAAISIIKPNQLEALFAQDPSMKDKIGIIDLQHKGPGVWSGMNLLFISADSKKKEETWKLIEFIMSEEQMRQRYKDVRIPVVRTSMQEEYIQEDPLLNQAIIRGIEVGVGQLKVAWSPLLFFTYLPQIQQQAFFGRKTPEEATRENFEQFLKDIEDIQ